MGSKGSYSQFVVGGMLLLIAFFFGRYINQQPIADQSTNEREELVGALDSPGKAPSPSDQLASDSDAQKSLRERILNQRAQAKQPNTLNESLVKSNQVAENESKSQPDFSNAFVEPDFSHLQTFESAPPIRLPKLPFDLTEAMNKADPATRSNAMKTTTGRFTINRPNTRWNAIKPGYRQSVRLDC